MSEIRVFAPASVGNLGCGFDVLGLAVERLGDRVVARPCKGTGVRLREVVGDGGRLPRSAERNTASVAAAAVLASQRCDAGVELVLHKGLPLASGLGSSAASAVAGAVAVDALLELGSSTEVLLAAALEGERAGCGAAHPDNVAASLVGGAVLCRGEDGRDVIRLPVPEELALALVRPHLEVSTGAARRLLPKMVPLAKAVTQWGNVAGVVAGLCLGDLDLLGRSLTDVVAEPARARLVPGLAAAKQAAMEAGACGAGLSGSGPTVFAVCRGLDQAERVAAAMRAAFLSNGLDADAYHSEAALQGARVVTA